MSGALTDTAQGTREPKARLTWLDANRVWAAIGVVLIHSTTDTAGAPFTQSPPAERVVPAILRSLSEVSSSEIFFMFSFFLLAAKLSKREASYGHVLADQAKRLLVPFLAWTAFYALFRLVKASAFGYEEAIWAQLHTTKAWVGYVMLGSAQYHLHFIPTLCCLLLAYPLYRGAQRYPAAGAFALCFGLYALSSGEGWLWGHVKEPLLRDYLVRGLKIACYTGYGMAAFALQGIQQRGLSAADAKQLQRVALALAALAQLATLPYIAELALTGRWVVRPGAAYYGHFLLPALVFACFMGGAYANWPPLYSKLSKYTFGVYLVHPIFVDLFDVAVRKLDVQLSPSVGIVAKFALAVPAAFGLSYLLSKSALSAWLVGLQERKGAEGTTGDAKVAAAVVRASVQS